jgi:8-oxo-dGTP diphosphatase
MKTIAIAKALMLDSAGSMLILRRSDTHPTLALHADLPGGQVDEGEDIGQALVREVKEEIGMTITLSELTPVYGGAEVHNDENRVRLLYIVRLDDVRPAVTLSWEHSQAEWLPTSKMAEIENEYHSFYHDALRYIRENNILED